jgi:hypothetical protein
MSVSGESDFKNKLLVSVQGKVKSVRDEMSENFQSFATQILLP